SFLIEISPGTGATSRTYHRSTTPEFTADASNLVTALDLETLAYADEGLAQSTQFYGKTLATNAFGSTESNEIAYLTGTATRPAMPTLALITGSETIDSAAFTRSAYSHPDSTELGVSILRIEDRLGNLIAEYEVAYDADTL